MAGPRIDAIMLSMDEPAHWREAALASLDHPDIAVRVIPTSRQTRMGDDWAAHIATSTAPYLTFVDPDNLYHADVFARLADLLDANPRGGLAYANERLIDADGREIGCRRLAYSPLLHAASAALVHSCVLFRADLAKAERAWLAGMTVYPEWALTLRLAARAQVMHLPSIGRSWRQHPGQAHRRDSADDVARIRAMHINL